MIAIKDLIDVEIKEGLIEWITESTHYRFQDIVFQRYRNYFNKPGFIYYQHTDSHWMILK